MTIPRLIACGADRENVTIIHHVERKGKANTFSLKDDIELVRRKLAEARRRNRPYDVFIINPLTSYFGSHQTLRVALIGRTASMFVRSWSLGFVFLRNTNSLLLASRTL